MKNKKWYIKIWDEGKYIDFWSFNHFLCGFVFAKIITLVELNFFTSILVISLLVMTWEVFEMKKNIKETATNRIVDIIIGLLGFFGFFFGNGISKFSNLAFISIFLIPLLILEIWGYIAYRLENGKK